jgi:1-acyl-sn-glycerol-3-phosphate acyltransferase/nucleoside-diphosphate-sugar epimerase
MARVIVADERDYVAETIISALRECPAVEFCQRAPTTGPGIDRLAAVIEEQVIDTVVYSPGLSRAKSALPDLLSAEAFFRGCAQARIKNFILLASAAVWDCTHYNPGLISESRPLADGNSNPIARSWIQLERMARAGLGSGGVELTILRLVPMPVRGRADYFSRLFAGRLAFTLPGYNPSIQLLTPVDLAVAVRRAIENGSGGVFNVAPDSVIPLSHALRLAGVTRVPAPYSLQRIFRAVLTLAGLARPIDEVGYIRYSFTVSNAKVKRELGFAPSRSSAEALLELRPDRCGRRRSAKIVGRDYDPFGMDKDYIDAFSRTLFTFLERYYWRIEVDGFENVPRQGQAMLVGVHRGFMPWDGVMALHLMVRRIGRYPRFLVHPGLLRFPFLFNFIRRLGGVIACRENADYLLERDEMLGMFPEGVRGAFSLYRDAYRLKKFGRDEFVKMAVRNRTPIVPFVTVGSAEVFPILKKFEWKWWKRLTDWPCLPITPTFPLLPLPIPSKWHTQFLEPIHIEERYPPEAAADARIVRAISQEVRERLQESMDGMLARRRSIFHGSIFEHSSGTG